MSSGIYMIVNRVNRKFYVGKTRDFKQREYKHRFNLRRRTHVNRHLQNAWDKYGEKNFEFSLIEETSIKNLDARERFYIRLLNACEDGYNLMDESSGVLTHSAETREKLRSIVNEMWKTAEGIGRIKALRESTVKHEYMGEFKTSKEWAKEFGVNFTSFRQRLAKGMSVAEAKEIGPLNKKIKFRGRMMTLPEIAKENGLAYRSLWFKVVKCGLPLEEAVIGKTKTKIFFRGQYKSLRAWAREFGIKHGTLSTRIARGKSFEQAILT